MTEHRPPYQPLSSIIEEAPPDTLLLIPILQSGQATEDESICLHLVHLKNGNLGLCNAKTEQICPCCRLHTCTEHQSCVSMLFPDNDGDKEAPLCQTCAGLSREIRSHLHMFVATINKRQE